MNLLNSKSCVELHLHLDGAVRPSTIYELCKKKNIETSVKSSADMKDFIELKNPSTLDAFLRPFPLINSAIKGDKESLARIVEEFVEDCHNKSKLCYFEVRFCPLFLTNEELSGEECMKVTLEMLDRTSKKFGMEYTVILGILRTIPKMTDETIRLAKNFQAHGVSGIDIAGDDAMISHNLHGNIHEAYKEAKRVGLFRTAHAGENGTALAVKQAIEEFHATRIGHGYKALEDPEVYQLAKDKNVHFEVCPWSAVLTGSASTEKGKHPIVRFLEDEINFSINTDDPSVTGKWLQDEYEFCEKSLGVTKIQIQAANIRAAENAFLPEERKKELVNHVVKHSSKTIAHYYD